MKKLLAIFISFIILPIFINANDDKIKNIVNAIDENTLYNYIETIQNFGPHPTGSEECEKVCQFIYREFSKYLDTEYYEWENEKYIGKNVIATIKGKTNSSIILSAHYDSYYNSPGADDDGTGIACLLMAAKILSKYEFKHNIKLVAFSGEEQGMLGSADYVRHLYENGEDIIADINVDTVGHASSREGGKLIRVLTDEASIWITDIAEEISYEYNLDISLYRQGNFPAGDHQSFIDYGYEAVFFVEYEFNKNIHTPNDIIEYVNISYLTKVCKLVLATVAKIADYEFPIRAKFEEPKIGKIYINDREILTTNKPYPIIFGRTYARINVMGKAKRVEFFIDDELKCIDENSPYECIYKDILFFKHKLKAIAVSINGTDICRMNAIIFNILPPGPPH